MSKFRFRKAAIALTIAAASCLGAAAFSACDFGFGVTKGTIALEETERTMYVADTYKLTLTLSDEDANVTWKSSDEKVASVRRGTVTAKAPGKATITASLDDGTSASCEITVLDRTIEISETEITLNLDEEVHTATLTATASDGGAVTWSTSDPSVVSVTGGVIKALDVGEATITAQRGAAKATCVVHVIMPSRPADYRRLESGTNSTVASNPDTWYYFADGTGSEVEYAAKPYYQSNSVTVSISRMSDAFLSEEKKFFFRYQPGKDKDGNELAVGDAVQVEFDILMNMDGKLVYGSTNYGTTRFKANELTHVTFKTTIGTNPLALRPGEFTPPTEEYPLTLTLSNFEFSKIEPELKVVDEDKTEVLPLDDTFTMITGDYEITQLKNAGCVADPGVMHYWPDGSADKDYVLVGVPMLTDGKASMTFSKVSDSGSYYFRYQPNLSVGTEYAITFTASVSQTAFITYGSKGNYKERTAPAGEELLITYYGTVNENEPFCIRFNSLNGSLHVSEETPLEFTFSSIGYKEAKAPVVDPTPDPSSEEMTKMNNQGTRENPGKWFYWADGAYELKEASKSESGVIVFDFNKISVGSTYQLRYQPEYAIGAGYQISAKIVASADCKIEFGTKTSAANAYNTVSLTAGEEYELVYANAVNDEFPFGIRIVPSAEMGAIRLTVSDIKIEEHELTDPDVPTPPTPEEKINMESGTKGQTCSNPGTWYYLIDNGDGQNQNTLTTAYYDEAAGSVTLAFTHMTEGKGYYLRYQPTLEAGKKYTITVDVVLNRTGAGLVQLMNDGAKKYEQYDTVAGEKLTLTFTDEVRSNEPFQIRLKAYNATAENPVELVVSNVRVEEVIEQETPDPVVESYDLDKKSNADTIKVAGTWTYMADGTNGTDYVLNGTPNYTNGVVTLSLSKMTSGKNYQLRYQPNLAVGTEYTLTMDVTYNRASYLLYSSEFKKVTFEEAGTKTISYTSTVDASTPFQVSIKVYDATEENPLTLQLSNIKLTANQTELPDPVVTNYELAKKSKGDTIKVAGTWTYMADGTKDTDYVLNGTPNYTDGTVTLSFSKMTAGKEYRLSYQPTYAVGSSYTITFKVALNKPGYIVYGKEYLRLDFEEAGEKEVTYTGTVDGSNPLLIILKTYDATEESPMTMTVSNIAITENK